MRLDRRLSCISIAVLFALVANLQSANAEEQVFADTIYVGSVTLGGSPVSCPSVTLASLPVMVKTRSRIVAYGSGVYHQNNSNLNVVALHIELEANNSIVAVSNQVPITAPFSGNVDPNNGNVFGAVNGVLQTGSDTTKITNGIGTPFVAHPGSYTLKLILYPASSPCPGQSFIGFVTLSYFEVPIR
jgi:hypothetical protein